MTTTTTRGSCYLCSKPCSFRSKLFRRCRHESACEDCLRRRYIERATDASFYPLECFHPQCRLPVRSEQIQRFCRSDIEIRRYHRLTRLAKTNEQQLGKDWRELVGVYKALGNERLVRCPGCGFFITREEGGCCMITCICGEEFNGLEQWESMERLRKSIPRGNFKGIEVDTLGWPPSSAAAPKKGPRLVCDDGVGENGDTEDGGDSVWDEPFDEPFGEPSWEALASTPDPPCVCDYLPLEPNPVMET